MANTKKYWKGIDELKETKSFQESKESEFSQSNSIESFLADDQLSESS
ncbi:MAG: TAT-variant-translocated molybdopterin oxidoreductase, partial [Flavobacteriales bacterium]|nr:TAT-variant-translocated molybdopterin oxidoreductase [Flavobacteriales bacterium]